MRRKSVAIGALPGYLVDKQFNQPQRKDTMMGETCKHHDWPLPDGNNLKCRKCPKEYTISEIMQDEYESISHDVETRNGNEYLTETFLPAFRAAQQNL